MRPGYLAVLLLLSAPLHAELTTSRLALATGATAAQPSLTVDAREGFVLTWQERGAVNRLNFAVISADGVELRHGEIASGKDWFVNGADFPSLAVLDNGDWVSFWLQKTAADTYAYSIRSVRSRDAGASWEAPVVIHRDATDTEHGFVSMTAAGADRVRLVWFDGRHMAGTTEDHEGAGEHMSLRSATLGRDGALGDERELDDLTCSCCQTDAVRGASRTLVAYRDRSAAEIRDIGTLVFGRRGWSKPTLVHADHWKIAGCPVNGPALAVRGERFAVLWPTMASGDMQLKLAFGDGQRFAEPIEWAAGAAELGRVDLSTWGSDGFLATRVRQGGAATELVLDALDASGKVLESRTVAQKVGGYPRLARFGDVALLAWAEAGAVAGSSSIGLARIGAPATAAGKGLKDQ